MALPSVTMRGIRRDLVALFEGDLGATEEAIVQLTEEPDVLCSWATRMLRRDDPHAPAFRWEEVPGPIKAVAVRGMAMAYLLDTWGGISREHVNQDRRRAS